MQAWDPLPPVVMRKYIAYARKYCHPVLDDEAKQVIQDFYLQLRKRKNFMDSTPVTTRQLEALIRLAVCVFMCWRAKKLRVWGAFLVSDIYRLHGFCAQAWV